MKHLFTLSEWLRAKWERFTTIASSAMQSLKATKRQSDTTIFAENLKILRILRILMSIFANRGVKDVRVSLGQYLTKNQLRTNLYLTPNSFFTRFAAVFALVFVLGVGNVWGADVTYTLTINGSDFNTTSYAANNNEKTTDAVCTTDNKKTYEVSWTSNQVMKNGNNMQWQKSKGYIYNSTDLGTISSVTVNSSAGSFTTYYGTSEQPSSGSAGSGKGYFKTSVGGATGTTSNIVVTFVISEDDGGSSEPTPSLEQVTVSGTPSTKTYDEGDVFDVTGLVVTGSYDIGDDAAITEGITWEARTSAVADDAAALNAYTLTAGQTALQVRATVSEIASSWFDVTGLTVNEHVVTQGTYSITPNTTFWGCSDINKSNATENEINYTGSQNDITITIKNGKKQNAYINSTQTRVYSDGYTMAFSVPSGYNITAIVFTADGSNWAGTHTASVGTMTDNKHWSGKANSVTITFGGTCRINGISVTYEAIAPEVTVDPASLSFTAKQNIAVEGKKFTLEGANLTSGLTLAASTGFSVSPTSLTAEAAMAQGGAEVTVTPATPTATTTPVEGTVTISGGGLSESVEVALSMAVTPTYLVGIAVNSNTMGSATINGGTASIYVTDDEEIALVATPAEHHEFVNWTVSDENIVLDNENAATTTALAAAAGTITANFQLQQCAALVVPTLDKITKDYQSATIAWNTVANASSYAVSVVNHSTSASVFSGNVNALSKALTGLAANTRYDYTVMAIGDGTNYCDANNPVLENYFTTDDYPAATLSLVENGGTPYNWGTGLKLNSVIALPEELAGLGCSDKVLVGWDANENCATAPTYAKGANYTIASTADVLYAVFATEQAGEVTKHDVFATTSLGSTNTVTSGFAVSAQAESKSGYYQDGSGTTRYVQVKVSNAETQIIPESPTAITVKAKIGGGTAKDPLTNNVYAVLIDADQNAIGDPVLLTTKVTAATGSDFEASMPIANYANVRGARVTHEKETSYNVRYYAISLSYSTGGGVSHSGYTTECTAQLPVLAAPTFSVTEGTYYEGQSIELDAADGATIYYVIDADEITDQNRTEYTSAISLSEYGVHTIKAIAIQDGYEDSPVAEATYTIGKTFASVSALFSYLDENSLTSLNNVKVSGLVSQIKSIDPSKYTNGQYYISDNGQQENELYLYNGKYINGADFTDNPACPLEVGDAVTVIGNYILNNTTRELNAGNYIVTRTAAEVASITIGGSASKTTYSEEDNIFSYSGLTATATYNTGYEKDVTAVAVWSNDLEDNIVSEAGDVTVTASWGGKNDTKVVAVSYTTKTVASIRLEYASAYTFVGFDLPKPKVYASYVEDIPEEEVTELLTDDNYDTEHAYNKNEAGNYTIKVGYKSKETTYSVTVKAIYNTQETAHSVADAIEIIKKSTYTSTSADPTAMYVHGFVCTTGTPNNNGQLTYYINDTEEEEGRLQVYQGKYFENASFDSNNNLAKGDEVIIEGHMLYYNSATPELKASPLVYLLKKALPTISVEDVAELEVGQADLDVTELITKQGNGVVSLESSDLEKLTVDGLTLHAIGAGDVTVTANLAATANEGSINYKANSTTFTVHVIAARTRYTVTFDANGADGGSAPEAIADQLEGATVDLQECTYTWANHGFTGWKVINLSTEAEIEVENNHFTMPAANVKIQAQWEEIATTHVVFNVNGNTETVAAVDVPQEVEYSITQVTNGQNGYEFVGWAESPETEDVEEAIATIESYTPEAGEASKTLYAVFKRVDEGAPKTDVLTAADLAATTTGYVEFSNVRKTSAAVYAGNTAKSNSDAIQLRSSNNSGIVAITSGGILKSVKITVANGSNTLDVYGSNTAYTGASNLYASATQGTKIGYTSSTTTINAAADYNYVGIRSNSGAIYLSSVEITWQPKTTYYTTAPSAVYAVSYVLGEGGAWEGDACEGANVKAGQTFDICENVPVREHYKFVKWQVAGEDVSGTITINAETAITAVWEAKVENDITYKAGTGTGDDAVVGNNEEGAEIVLPSAAEKSLSKEGYNFVGWLYNEKLYEAGQTFEMPASAVTFVAQWKKQNITKMTLITNASQLVNGSKVVLANQTASTVAGESAKESDTYLTKADGTFNEDKSILTNLGDGIELTLVQVTGGWALEYNGKYLKPYSTNKVAWDAAQTVWTISISSNNAIIETPGNSGSALRYNKNSGSERFSAYSSKESCEPIQLYASVTAITDDASISDLGYVEGDVIVVNSGAELTIDVAAAPASITVESGATVTVAEELTADDVIVKENATMTINEATEANNITVENGATIEVGATTAANNLVIQTTSGSTVSQGKSGQLTGSVMPVVSGDLFIEIKLCEGAMDAEASGKWYCISAPFNVNMNGGFFWGDGTPMVLNTDFQLFEWDGDRRATGISGWKRVSGVMKAGIAYFIGFDDARSNQNIIKLKATNKTISNKSKIEAPKHSSSVDDKYANWNGLANPNFRHIALNKNVQAFDYNVQSYNTYATGEYNFVVGTPFFIKETGDITIEAADNGSFRAPKREVEQLSYCVRIAREGKAGFDNQMYVRASEEASASYEEGHDLVTMNAETSNYGALLWTVNYGGKRLAIEEAPLVNDKASYALSLYAPADGAYRIETPTVRMNADLYLTYEGAIIWDLSMGAYEAELAKGTNNGYGLLLVKKMPMTPTGVEQSEVSHQPSDIQKIIINDNVFILRGGQMYDVTGKAVK